MIGPQKSLGSVKHNIYILISTSFFSVFQVSASGFLEGVLDGSNEVCMGRCIHGQHHLWSCLVRVIVEDGMRESV